jgi:RNA polymerase sigma-70 factor (ECF subfamily)
MTTDQYRDELAALLPRLWRYAMVKCRDPDRANDLVQATRERALSRSHQFQTGTRLDAWTITIMQSIWKNDLRREPIRRGAGRCNVSAYCWTRLSPRRTSPASMRIINI